MSAKLHLAFSKGVLQVRNVTSGEASLYYILNGETQHIAIAPGTVAWVDLLKVAPLAAWKKHPSLQNQVRSGTLEVKDV